MNRPNTCNNCCDNCKAYICVEPAAYKILIAESGKYNGIFPPNTSISKKNKQILCGPFDVCNKIVHETQGLIEWPCNQITWDSKGYQYEGYLGDFTLYDSWSIDNIKLDGETIIIGNWGTPVENRRLNNFYTGHTEQGFIITPYSYFWVRGNDYNCVGEPSPRLEFADLPKINIDDPLIKEFQNKIFIKKIDNSIFAFNGLEINGITATLCCISGGYNGNTVFVQNCIVPARGNQYTEPAPHHLGAWVHLESKYSSRDIDELYISLFPSLFGDLNKNWIYYLNSGPPDNFKLGTIAKAENETFKIFNNKDSCELCSPVLEPCGRCCFYYICVGEPNENDPTTPIVNPFPCLTCSNIGSNGPNVNPPNSNLPNAGNNGSNDWGCCTDNPDPRCVTVLTDCGGGNGPSGPANIRICCFCYSGEITEEMCASLAEEYGAINGYNYIGRPYDDSCPACDEEPMCFGDKNYICINGVCYLTNNQCGNTDVCTDCWSQIPEPPTGGGECPPGFCINENNLCIECPDINPF